MRAVQAIEGSTTDFDTWCVPDLDGRDLAQRGSDHGGEHALPSCVLGRGGLLFRVANGRTATDEQHLAIKVGETPCVRQATEQVVVGRHVVGRVCGFTQEPSVARGEGSLRGAAPARPFLGRLSKPQSQGVCFCLGHDLSLPTSDGSEPPSR